MKYPCENCKLRAAYDKNPKSLIGRFWRWQINFCPSWRGYFKSKRRRSQIATNGIRYEHKIDYIRF